MILVITGSRTIKNAEGVQEVLDRALTHTLSLTGEPLYLILGDCPTGADAAALDWAHRMGIDYDVLVADWATHGRKAGPFRNTAMIERALTKRSITGEDVYCLAFVDKPIHNSRGTNDCYTKALKAQFKSTVYRL